MNIAETEVIGRAKAAVADLLKLARPRGPIDECRIRTRVRRSAKYLSIDLAKLEAELAQAAIVDPCGRDA